MIIERLKEIAEKTVQFALKQKVTQAEASAFLWDTALTRYANSQVHQNVAAKNGGSFIRVVLKNKIGILRVNTLEEKQIEKAVSQAIRIAGSSTPNKDFKSLPAPEKWTPIKDAYDENTATCTPNHRIEVVKKAIETAHSKSPIVKSVAGYFSTGFLAYSVANSLGISAWAKISIANMKTTVISVSNGSEGFGTAEKYSRNVKDIDPVALAEDAAENSVNSVDPVQLDPGEYEVVLSPLAVGNILFYMGYVGFSATSFQDGESFVRYCLNQQVFDEKLNVKDDPRDPHTLYAVPIDGEGVPKRKMQLIQNGIVSEKSICYDSLKAGKEGKKSTGHSIPPVTRFYVPRPLPYNIIIEHGDSAIDEMISETKRGIFVTTFHYVNPVEPTKVIFTGLTRDGTFLIEHGEITKPIVNMRFTDSMLSALREIPLIGKEVETFRMTAVPAMKLKKLRFVGTSMY